jgi:acylphosphatase
MKATRVLYEGYVQGVGFRFTARHIAHGYDVSGWVRNLPDGRVELQVSGEDEEVAAFLRAIRESELGGHISAEHITEIEIPSPFKGFRIAF